MFNNGFEFPERAAPLTARELVDFGGHDGCRIDGVAQPFPRRQIARQTRVSRVHQQYRGYLGGMDLPLPPEVRPRERFELSGRFPSPARVSVAGEIDKQERRPSAPNDTVDVCQPGLAWIRAGPRDALAHQRVNQARLADVRAADQGNLGQSVVRQIARARSADDEAGLNLHRAGAAGKAGGAGWCVRSCLSCLSCPSCHKRQWVIVSSTIAVSTGACASGVRAVRGPASAIFRTSSIVWTM
jgi:hypothetical protein